MRVLLVAWLWCVAVAQQQQQQQQQRQPSVRMLPANQLRDYPGMCFAATNFNHYLPGMQWSLFPVCGVAQCVRDDRGRLLERVADCGVLPKHNPKCVVANADSLNSNSTVLPFPQCCPDIRCPPGVQLEYPSAEELEREKQEHLADLAKKITAAYKQAAQLSPRPQGNNAPRPARRQ